MKLVGFSFHKIKAEKNKEVSKETKANIKVDVMDISSLNNTLTEDQGVLRIDFNYVIEYTGGIGKIDLEGYILLATDKAQVKTILDSWKGKKLSGTVKSSIFNIILRKANVRALGLEEELSLPLHMPMPRVETKEDSK